MMQPYEIDKDILSGFIDESLEELAPLDALFIEIEQDPTNADIVNTIFRPIHSIKGSAAFFGLLKIKTLSHTMEDILDQIRQKKSIITGELIGALLSGVDMLKTMLARVRMGQTETEDDETFHRQIAILIDINRNTASGGKERIETIAHILNRLILKLEEIRPHLAEPSTYLIDEAKALIHRLGPFGIDPIEKPTGKKEPDSSPPHRSIDVIQDILHEPIHDVLDDTNSAKVKTELIKLLAKADSEKTKSVIAKALEAYDAFMVHIGFDPLLQEMIVSDMNMLKRQGKWKLPLAPTAPASSPDHDTSPATKTASERRSGVDRRISPEKTGEKTMRVSEKNIDAFLVFVSELVVIEEMFSYLQKKLFTSREKDMASEFKRVIQTFSVLSRNLRESILAIRKVPARVVLQKAVRIVHDIACQENKHVDIRITGEDIHIDKSYVDMLDAPFTHIVRNAVDHGIETKAERRGAGKPETGMISISLEETKNSIELEIRDDGKGLNDEAICQKARDMGLIRSGQVVDRETIIDLLFMPGMSTARDITDISGRGVGMDVAQKNVEAAGGRIVVESQAGLGTSITISLPRNATTQIMDGFLVRTGEDIYVLPMNLIGESFSLTPDGIRTVAGKGEMVLRHGELFPIIRLGETLAQKEKTPSAHAKGGNHAPPNGTAISVAVNNRRHALMVDEIIGVQKVVVRIVEGIMTDVPLFDGAAMLGNGRVAMIIGTDGLSILAAG